MLATAMLGVREVQQQRPGIAARLRQARAGDVRALARVMAAAFQDDPVFTWLIPDDSRRGAALERFFGIELHAVGLAQGSVWTRDDLAGASISTPPGRWKLPWPVLLAHAPGFARVFSARLPKGAALLQLMEWRHVRRPHHYFAYIGVAPTRQGQGIGRALMQPTLHRCDQARLPAYLEASTERSAALYERLGFVLIDELRLGGSPPLRLMLRPPRVTS
ncbi:MAG: GNAT family N-acetyltransferase [Chloroflexi bacterium]|nr:MAG: GNAT family N-acetyltransferase [Chloroflexota bacterium]